MKSISLNSCLREIEASESNLKASIEVIRITNRFIEVEKMLELPILDHIILVPEGGYYSFGDEGLMKKI